MKREPGNNSRRLTADERLRLYGPPINVFKRFVITQTEKILRAHPDFLEAISASQELTADDRTIDDIFQLLKVQTGNPGRARAICMGKGTETENDAAAELLMSLAYMRADKEGR